MKGSIRHTLPVLLLHNSQADSRCSASAAPLASQSAIVSRFGGSGAKIPTRLDFGENEIAHLQRTARMETIEGTPLLTSVFTLLVSQDAVSGLQDSRRELQLQAAE